MNSIYIWKARGDAALVAVLILAVAFSLTGCKSAEVVQDRPVVVHVPVAQPCAGERPTPVTPLRTLYSDDEWRRMDVRQKAAAVGKQALDRLAYGDQLGAATAGCP